MDRNQVVSCLSLFIAIGTHALPRIPNQLRARHSLRVFLARQLDHRAARFLFKPQKLSLHVSFQIRIRLGWKHVHRGFGILNAVPFGLHGWDLDLGRDPGFDLGVFLSWVEGRREVSDVFVRWQLAVHGGVWSL
jgi:hypothetical protein